MGKKPTAAAAAAQGPSKRAKRNFADFEISSVSSAESDEDDDDDGRDVRAQETAEPEETPDEMRIRMAKDLLRVVEERTGGASKHDDDDDADGLDAVTRQLHHDILESEGRLRRECVAPLRSALAQGKPVERTSGRGRHRLSATGICVSEDETAAYSGSKDGEVAAWDVASGAKTWSARTRDACLCVAVSQDGRLLASAGGDAVHVWDTRERAAAPVRSLTGHRDLVGCLAFRLGTHVVLSGSMDRTVRVWNAAEGSFVEQLFGHQAPITGVDCLARERAVTCSQDLTVRLWKIPEESHLVLSGKHYASVDAVRMLDESCFASGSQDGSLALWHSSKRKPACVVTEAHGQGHWINAVAVVRNADLLASGSDDGVVRLWAVDLPALRIDPEPVAALEVAGNVNGLAFGQKTGRVLAVAHGQEHRLGRWRKHAGTRNGVCFFALPAAAAAAAAAMNE